MLVAAPANATVGRGCEYPLDYLVGHSVRPDQLDADGAITSSLTTVARFADNVLIGTHCMVPESTNSPEVAASLFPFGDGGFRNVPSYRAYLQALDDMLDVYGRTLNVWLMQRHDLLCTQEIDYALNLPSPNRS